MQQHSDAGDEREIFKAFNPGCRAKNALTHDFCCPRDGSPGVGFETASVSDEIEADAVQEEMQNDMERARAERGHQSPERSASCGAICEDYDAGIFPESQRVTKKHSILRRGMHLKKRRRSALFVNHENIFQK